MTPAAATMQGLSDELLRSILNIAKTDPKFPSHVLDTTPDDELLRMANRMAASCLDGSWRDQLSLDSRDRIVAVVQAAFTPKPEPHDPLAESAQRNVGGWDPWARASEIHAPDQVAVIDLHVENNIKPDGTGTFKIGGAA